LENSRYVHKNGKKLRTGYTTGSCAAAAAKGAVSMLFSGLKEQHVVIDTPKGWKLNLHLEDIFFSGTAASCCVVKDAGDDPDVTDGVRVYAEARRIEGTEILIKGGKGVGLVTKPGLPIPQGSPAINPGPRNMIIKEVKEVLPQGCGVEIEISIPQGVEIARKTFNPRLGITGGISILGTTGIVEPMSEDALKDTIALELSCRRAEGEDKLVLVPGSYGERFCRQWLGLSGERTIKMSNYLGFALEKCAELGFKKLVLAGHLAKLVKPAGGIFYTHSRVSDTRLEILTAHLAVLGMETGDLRRIMRCITVEEALPIINQKGFQEVYKIIAETCARKCAAYVYGNLKIGVVIFSMKKLLAKSSGAERILEEIRHG